MIESNDLDQVRRAAFELRFKNPRDAVRILRTLTKKGGEASALAHGALGEILLDDLNDPDGAEHHFRRLLAVAPGLPAGELGLARALGRNGRLDEAQEAFSRAISGLENQVREIMSQDEDAGGAEELLLTALETAVEERELARELAGEGSVRPSPDLWDWAERVRLFDIHDEVGEAAAEDWMRYAAMRAVLEAYDGELDTALATVDRVAALAPLPPHAVRHVRSMALEASGDIPRAADEALAAREEAEFRLAPAETLRAARLLVDAERESDARNLLERERQAIDEAMDLAEPEEAGELKEAREALDVQLAELPRPSLVTLGFGRLLRS